MSITALVWLIILIVVIVIIFLLIEGSKQREKKKSDDRLRKYMQKLEQKELLEKNYLQGKTRKQFYNDVYLKSDAWQRKRAFILKRDKWRCIYCGAKAVEVHHTKYCKNQIGKEPISWLVSVCTLCHKKMHLKYNETQSGNEMGAMPN